MSDGSPLKPNECSVTVVCDDLHPDDVEEIQRTLASNRYDFTVKVKQTVRAEHYPNLNVIGIDTNLFVQFSPKYHFGRTRQGGLNAVVRAVDEVLDLSTHNRDLRPKVSVDSKGRTLISMEVWLRPRAKKHSWTRDHKLELGTLLVGVIAALAAILVVPEFRRFFHLDKPEIQQQQPDKSPNVTTPVAPIQSTEPSKPTEVPKPKNSKPRQKTETHVQGRDDVGGNNVAGDHNILGNNQTTPTAVAPNGIAIAGGNVTNPTVNNYGPPPLPTPTVKVCVSPSKLRQDQTLWDTKISLKSDVQMIRPWFMFFFDAPVESTLPTLLNQSSLACSCPVRAEKLPNPDRSIGFRMASFNMATNVWYPWDGPIVLAIPSKSPVSLQKILSGAGDNPDIPFPMNIVYSCD